jgi:hypothetical protein
LLSATAIALFVVPKSRPMTGSIGFNWLPKV